MADTSSRQVVLIIEDEALVRMTAVDMIEEAGFEILEATNADEAILLLEARRDITVGLHRYRNAGFDGRPQARSCRQRPMAAHQNYRDIGPLRRTGRRSAVRRAVPGETLQLRPDFQRLTESHGPGLEHGLGRHPRAGSPVAAKKIRRPLETGSTFSSFLHAAKSGPGALRGPGGDGRRRCPTPARTHLAQRRIWL